jgi:hypothetical protein
MFLYFGKHFTQSAAGQRLARVECDRCGTGYCYQLSRVGTGVGVAPYCLGQARAARLAEQRAAKELERALDRGRELVPCPKCSWINEDLVQGYRRTRYRLWGRVAFYILGTAILLALTLVPLLAFGDPDALPIVALILLGIVLLSGGTLGIQMWLRGRINPNRNYPDAPELLPGTPPALLQDPISGEIKAASNGRIGVAPVGEWCDFQLGRHQLPPVCCVCLNEASDGHEHRAFHPAAQMFVPRCAECAGIQQRAYWRIFLTAALVCTCLSAAIVLPLNFAGDDFWIATAVALGASMLVAAIVAFRSTTPVTIARGDTTRNVIKLRFRNPAYTRLVAEQMRSPESAEPHVAIDQAEPVPPGRQLRQQ